MTLLRSLPPLISRKEREREGGREEEEEVEKVEEVEEVEE